MISEVNFSNGYSSFWIEYTPWLNGYIDDVNQSSDTKVESPIMIEDDPACRSVNSIVAFTRYREFINDRNLSAEESLELSLPIIAKFPRTYIDSFSLNDENVDIIHAISERIHTHYRQNIIVDPYFYGCGVIDNCNGDILQGDTLIEVKTGKRKLYASDIKQLLTYCALNAKSNNYVIKNIELYNPRMGLLHHSTIEQLVNDVSALSAYELFDEISKYVSDMTEKIIY